MRSEAFFSNMITIIHGNDIVSSRNYFLDLKKNHKDSYSLSESETNVTDLTQLLDDGSLFQNSHIIFIENFLNEKKKGKEKEAIIKLLIKNANSNNIFLWEKKEITKTSLAVFKEAIIKNFKLPAALFNFLDAIAPKNGITLVELFHKTLETTEAEMIFFMIIRQLRILLSLSDNQSEMITEAARLTPWQKPRLQKQAKLFKKEQLKSLYFKLFDIEKALKTGSVVPSLISVIDFFLAGI